MVRRERDGEEEVAQPVRPGEQFRRLRLRTMQRDQLPLRPSGDRPGDVEQGGRVRSDRENEGGERRVERIERVDLSLEPFDMPSLDARGRPRLPGRRRELGLGQEEFVPEAENDRADLGEGVRQLRGGEAEPRPELVVRAVGADPR
jgi:hypothetical protein